MVEDEKPKKKAPYHTEPPAHVSTAMEVIREFLAVEVPDSEYTDRRDLSVSEEKLKQVAINTLIKYMNQESEKCE